MNQILQAAASPETSAQLAEIGAALLVLGLVAFLANKIKFSVVPTLFVDRAGSGQRRVHTSFTKRRVLSYRCSNWCNYAFAALGPGVFGL